MLLIVATYFLNMTGCNFNYQHSTLRPEQFLAETPETTLIKATHTIVRNGSIVAEIKADLVENYPLESRDILKNVHYEEFDSMGKIITTGSADLVAYNTKSRNAAISGSVVLRSESYQAWIQTDELHWDLDLDLLRTGSDQNVKIIRDDSSEISGSGFQANLRNNVISFSKSVVGSLFVKTAADY